MKKNREMARSHSTGKKIPKGVSEHSGSGNTLLNSAIWNDGIDEQGDQMRAEMPDVVLRPAISRFFPILQILLNKGGCIGQYTP